MVRDSVTIIDSYKHTAASLNHSTRLLHDIEKFCVLIMTKYSQITVDPSLDI